MVGCCGIGKFQLLGIRTQALFASGLTGKVENLAAVARALQGGDGEFSSYLEIRNSATPLIAE